MTVGGWFDAEDLFGALETYRRRGHQPAAHEHLVMGPWTHGGWARGDGDPLGPVAFDAKTGEFYREKIELPFFQYHLKGKGIAQLPEGLGLRDRHQPVADASTPGRRKEAKPTIALPRSRGGGSRSTRRPMASPRRFDEYVSDPAKPVPLHRQDRDRHVAAIT